MRIGIAFLILFGSLAAVRADDKIALVQQQLKDQGFYYGEITGEKNADTSAAIRRFQIRNGLQITGELKDEPSKALRSNASATPATTAAPTPAIVNRAPSPRPDTSDLRDNNNAPEADEDHAPTQRYAAPPQPRQPELGDADGQRGSVDERERDNQIYPGRPGPGAGGRFTGEMFGGTPYAHAPPEVQHQVGMDAQTKLAR